MRKRARRSQKWNPIVYSRWAVVYDHDGAPVDGAIFVHRPAAERFRSEQSNPRKYRVQRVEINNADASA